MEVTRNLSAEATTTTVTHENTSISSGIIEIDHNHPMYLHPNDTLGSSVLSIQLTGSENYALWRRSMALSLVEKNKIGFVDSRYFKSSFDESVHD